VHLTIVWIQQLEPAISDPVTSFGKRENNLLQKLFVAKKRRRKSYLTRRDHTQ
jgi:hypothetical protein